MLSSKKINQILDKQSVIYFPKPNQSYQIMHGKDIYSISFTGKRVSELKSFDLLSGLSRWKDGTRKQMSYYVSKEHLPPSYRNSILPPFLFIPPDIADKAITNIIAIKNIEFDCDSGIYQCIRTPIKSTINTFNFVIKKRFQKAISNISIKTGKYPIFLDKNLPSISYLNNLYSHFIDCNPSLKLDEQYKNTASFCHIRAHLISDLLRENGIQTLKVYKLWNVDEWASYSSNKMWIYHCATLLIDNQKEGWVWDPWVGNNKTLLSFKQWSHRTLYEPKPREIIITNHVITADYYEGATPDGINFKIHTSPDQFNAYQAVASCIPNSPDKPLIKIAKHKKETFKISDVNYEKENKLIDKNNSQTSNSLTYEDKFLFFTKQKCISQNFNSVVFHSSRAGIHN